MPRSAGRRTLANRNALSVAATKGFVDLPIMAGAPTVAPVVPSGSAPSVVDTVGQTLWVYLTGVGWVDLHGQDGAAGSPGTNGTNGASMLSGSGVPSGGLGADNDLYLNTANSDYYKKIGGTWTLQGNLQGAAGSPGTNGTNGATWHTGSGVPSSGLGVDNDLYQNTANGDYYKKIGGTWTLQGNLQGAAGSPGTNGTNGTNGATWHTGSGVPSSGLGVDNDLYQNTANGDYYKKVSGTWTLQGNLKGPAGDPGSSDLTIGMIIARVDAIGAVSTPTPGANWKLCNGGAISGGTYNGQNVPNLHERFLRGVTSGGTGGMDGDPTHTHGLCTLGPCQFVQGTGGDMYYLQENVTASASNLPPYFNVEYWIKVA